MTKIKDLATVAVDNAYTLFPIDSERYELLVCLEAFLHDPDFCRDGNWHLLTRNECIIAWFRQTDRNFIRVAHSFWVMRHSTSFPARAGLILDRSRRFQATVRTWLLGVLWGDVNEAMPEVLVHYLWRSTRLAFASANAKLTDVPKGRRLSI